MSWLRVCVDGTQNPQKVLSVGNVLFRLPKRKPNRAAVHTIKMAKRLVTLLKSKCLLRSSISYTESSGFLFSGWPPGETLGCEIDSSFENCVWQFSTTFRSVLYSEVCLFGLPQTEFSRRFRSIVKNCHLCIYFLKCMSTKTRVPPGQRSANQG